MVNNLEWEANWIRENLNKYDSPMHAEAVIKNIEKRYLINCLQKNINKLEEKLERGHQETDTR